MITRVSFDKQQFSNLQRMLRRLPEDWQREDAMMGVFRKAGKPMLQAGKASLLASVVGMRRSVSKSKKVEGASRSRVLHWESKVDKTRTIMRVGLVNKGDGRLGHLFNWGTVKRRQYTTGRSTGQIKPNRWWDKAVTSAMPSVLKIVDTESYRVIGRYVRRYLK